MTDDVCLGEAEIVVRVQKIDKSGYYYSNSSNPVPCCDVVDGVSSDAPVNSDHLSIENSMNLFSLKRKTHVVFAMFKVIESHKRVDTSSAIAIPSLDCESSLMSSVEV